MARLRLTVVVEYDANGAHYATSDPAEMARIDQESLGNGDMGVADILQIADREATVKVEPV